MLKTCALRLVREVGRFSHPLCDEGLGPPCELDALPFQADEPLRLLPCRLRDVIVRSPDLFQVALGFADSSIFQVQINHAAVKRSADVPPPGFVRFRLDAELLFYLLYARARDDALSVRFPDPQSPASREFDKAVSILHIFHELRIGRRRDDAPLRKTDIILPRLPDILDGGRVEGGPEPLSLGFDESSVRLNPGVPDFSSLPGHNAPGCCVSSGGERLRETARIFSAQSGDILFHRLRVNSPRAVHGSGDAETVLRKDFLVHPLVRLGDCRVQCLPVTQLLFFASQIGEISGKTHSRAPELSQSPCDISESVWHPDGPVRSTGASRLSDQRRQNIFQCHGFPP